MAPPCSCECSSAAALACLPALAWPQAAPDDPLAYLGWMKDLAGSCWQGTDATGKTTDRQCYEIQFRAASCAARSRSSRSTTSRRGFRGDSLFHRDAKTGRIAIVLWASNGSVSLSEALVDGEAIRFVQRRRRAAPRFARAGRGRVRKPSPSFASNARARRGRKC